MTATVKAPWHLWVVAILAVLWNAMGCFDYYATQSQMESYMSQFTPEQLEYFYGFPTWVDACWAVAVWGSLLASLLLLVRKAWAVWLFGLAILGMIGTSIYSFGLSSGMELMGSGAMAFTAVIWVIALFLFFYSKAMAKKGVLG